MQESFWRYGYRTPLAEFFLMKQSNLFHLFWKLKAFSSLPSGCPRFPTCSLIPVFSRSHYNRVVLRRTFEGWRDEWWSSRREWSLNMRADCHYRSLQYIMKDFYSWITKVCSCIHAAFISGITCATGLSTAGECLCVCRGKRRCNSKRLSHLVWLLPFKRNVGLGIFFFFLSDFIIHWRVITHFVSIISWQAADASGVGQMGGFHRDEKTEEQNAGISSWAVQALSYAVRFVLANENF